MTMPHRSRHLPSGISPLGQRPPPVRVLSYLSRRLRSAYDAANSITTDCLSSRGIVGLISDKMGIATRRRFTGTRQSDCQKPYSIGTFFFFFLRDMVKLQHVEDSWPEAVEWTWCLPDSPKLGLWLGFRRIGTEPWTCWQCWVHNTKTRRAELY